MSSWVERGGGRRDGFGVGRAGRGAGRTNARTNVWQRINNRDNIRGDQGKCDEENLQLGARSGGGEGETRYGDNMGDTRQRSSDMSRGTHSGDGGAASSAWERAAGKQPQSDRFANLDEHDRWNKGLEKGADDRTRDVGPGQKGTEETNQGRNRDLEFQRRQSNENPRNVSGKLACEVCGLKNHKTEECRRKMFCELCGYANHVTLDCKRESFWNVGPELCAAQVTKQSFFFIDENIDPKASKDKASTAIISVVKGNLTAKMIENEFKRLVSSTHWKWLARQVADNKYTMRFPTPKMLSDFSNFILGIKKCGCPVHY